MKLVGTRNLNIIIYLSDQIHCKDKDKCFFLFFFLISKDIVPLIIFRFPCVLFCHHFGGKCYSDLGSNATKSSKSKDKCWAGYLNALYVCLCGLYITKPVNGFWNFIYRSILVILYGFKLVYECQSSIYIFLNSINRFCLVCFSKCKQLFVFGYLLKINIFSRV